MTDTVLVYRGRPITDLTKDELVDAMTWAFQEIEYQRKRADRFLSELSPSTQAVLDAFRFSHTGQGCLAAALRAVADQVVPKCDMPRFADDATHADWVARDDVHDDLLRIAAEIEANL